MFLDLDSGDNWGAPICKSCKTVIGPSDPTEVLRFDQNDEHRLDEMNGLYHAQCAKPFMSMLRALEALWRV